MAVAASPEPFKGTIEGCVAGVICFATTDGHVSCGAPEVWNAEFSAASAVPTELVRWRSGEGPDYALV